MIKFEPVKISDKQLYDSYLMKENERGCQYSFANLFMWGRQNAALLEDHIAIFSQFNRRSVYPYLLGQGDKRAVMERIIADSEERGIPCRITGLDAEAIEFIEKEFPGKFRIHSDRDSHDYVYDINDLADLGGRRLHSKRNHCARFRALHPDYRVEPISIKNIEQARAMADEWFADKMAENPDADLHMEMAAISKAFRHYDELEMEGLLLIDGERVLALTLGSRLSPDTFDIHFEKAKSGVDGAYAVINNEFAKYLREKHAEVRFLNREEDMGIEGLRKAKLSYRPHHMVEKWWACLLEDGYDY